MTKWGKFLQRTLLAVALGGFSSVVAELPVRADDTLTIGSPAPALDIEHWVNNGNGRFKPVKEFDKGKVYVVEFWATWCGPCVASMPHLVELQERFGDKGVQVISISDEDLETVNKFLEREVSARGKPDAKSETPAEESKAKTYRELTAAYCLTADPDRSSHESYMTAAGQNGIPCAFVVGKDQKIEWIGHPMSMDEVLEKVVDGKWDRETFAAEFAEQQKLEILMSKAMRAARGGKIETAVGLIDEAIKATKSEDGQRQLSMMKVQLLMQTGKAAEAMKAVDEMISAAKTDEAKSQLKMMRIQVLLQDTDNKQLGAALVQAYKDFQDNPGFVNFIAWSVYEKMAAGEIEDKELLKASRAAAEKAAADAEGDTKAAVLDTAAHLQFLDGDKAAAIKTQQQAVELAPAQLKEELSGFLKELQE